MILEFYNTIKNSDFKRGKAQWDILFQLSNQFYSLYNELKTISWFEHFSNIVITAFFCFIGSYLHLFHSPEIATFSTVYVGENVNVTQTLFPFCLIVSMIHPFNNRTIISEILRKIFDKLIDI